MNLPLLCCYLGLLTQGVPSAASPTEAANRDLEKMQGTWRVVHAEMRGEAMPAEERNKVQITIKGDKISVEGTASKDIETLALDPTKDPKWINMTITVHTAFRKVGDQIGKPGEPPPPSPPPAPGDDKAPPAEKRTTHGVYDLNGDTLKLYFPPNDEGTHPENRPKTLAAKGESQGILLILERVKEKTK